MGILLDKKATAAWRKGSERWEAISSRLVMATLKWVGREQRRSGGSRGSMDVFVSVFCASEVLRPSL